MVVHGLHAEKDVREVTLAFAHYRSMFHFACDPCGRGNQHTDGQALARVLNHLSGAFEVEVQTPTSDPRQVACGGYRRCTRDGNDSSTSGHECSSWCSPRDREARIRECSRDSQALAHLPETRDKKLLRTSGQAPVPASRTCIPHPSERVVNTQWKAHTHIQVCGCE